MPNHPTRLSRLRDFKIRAPGFSPAATPVNRFTDTDAGTRMARLAQSLQSVAPGLRRYALQADQLQDAEEAQDAENAFEKLREADMTYKEAIREGAIQEHQSPIFRARLQELQGRQKGEEAMHEWNVYKAENLTDAVTLDEFDAAFDEFLGDYSESTLGDAPPALERSFMQTVQTRLLADRNKFSREAGARIVQTADNEFYQTVFQGTMGRLQDGASADEIAEWASASLEAHQSMAADTSPGRRRATNRRALEAMTDAAARMAMLTDNPGDAHRVLQALQKIPTGTGTLGASQWAQELIQQAEDEIYGNIAQRDGLAEREAQNRATEIVDEARASLFDNPRQSLASYKRRLGNIGLAGERANAAINSLERFRQGLIGSQELPSNPNTRVNLWRRIITNPTDVSGNLSAIEGSVVQKELSFGDAQNLYALAQNTAARAPAGGHPEAVLDDDTYDFLFREFRLLFPEDIAGSARGITNAKRLQAVAEYNAAWIDWWESHPDEHNDPDAKIEFGLKLSERIAQDHGVINTRNTEQIRRAPELAWKAGPIMQPETFGAIRAHVVDGVPLSAFPERVQEAVEDQFATNGIALWDDEQATAQLQRLVEYQEPYYTTDSTDPASR